ncbi:hypothetical protein Syun_004814 [Stephania yunnanensis]|uniref:Uncharacterized protein n=1 Tax=Stephania yunnanensis TaxID=152371 RepID=A0AAP0Q165_9MAGN
MTKARPRSPEYQEHVAIDPVMVAVMERCGSKGARQLGNCLDHKEWCFTWSRTVLQGAERGERVALLLSPQRPAFRHPCAAEMTDIGSQFTFFLTAPLQAFCHLTGLSPSNTDKEIFQKADLILSSAFSEWEIKLCTSTLLDLVWAQVLSDPFLRRLILRFVFCRSVLFFCCPEEDREQYQPCCLPLLPDFVSPNSKIVQSNIFQLADSLGVTDYFHFDALDQMRLDRVESEKRDRAASRLMLWWFVIDLWSKDLHLQLQDVLSSLYSCVIVHEVAGPALMLAFTPSHAYPIDSENWIAMASP